MSILYPCYKNPVQYEGDDQEQINFQEREKRDLFEDMHNGIELIREFKKRLNELHPSATNYIIRLMQ